VPEVPANSGVKSRAIWPLQALNFFMADMQAGIGPFLGVFLLAHGWQSGLIGSVMTIGGVAGMMMTGPAGALIDATSHKRNYVVIPGVCTVLASAVILLSQNFWFVAVSQIATAIAGAAIGPAVSGITLGIVRQSGFNRQVGHNQAWAPPQFRSSRRSVLGANWPGVAGRPCRPNDSHRRGHARLLSETLAADHFSIASWG
jgi:MFS family permease